MASPLLETVRLGAEFWNDSCDLRELGAAVARGAVGATSNPVIVQQAVTGDPQRWIPLLDALVRAHPHASEDMLAWLLVEEMARQAAALLLPAFTRSGGRTGRLCAQVNPQLYRDPERMIEHGRRLAGTAPNLAVKIPATADGLLAMEALVSEGIRVNATVSFTVAQALAAAAAIERGGARAKHSVAVTQVSGADAASGSVVTLMVGRLDDHLARVMEQERITLDPGLVAWAGVAVFKRTAELFRTRGVRPRLLAAAYRHQLHWTELIGENVILSMPYRWWTQFEASGIAPQASLRRPVEAATLERLRQAFPDFCRAYDEEGLRPEQFVQYGASTHTLAQFLGGYQQLLQTVRERMLI